MEGSLMTQSSLRSATATIPGARDVKKVPFVELYDGRLQGVVSSGSDIQRVYVSFFEAGTRNFSCSTNNNRPCGGLGGSYPCNHLRELLGEAIEQYGVARVAAFLGMPGDLGQYQQPHDILRALGSSTRADSGTIFSRFLGDLALLELPADSAPLHTTAWF